MAISSHTVDLSTIAVGLTCVKSSRKTPFANKTAPVGKTEAAVDGEWWSAIGLNGSPVPSACPAPSLAAGLCLLDV